MPGNDAFEVEGRIVEVYGNRTCLVGLPNGHQFTGFVTGRHQAAVGILQPGHRVRARLSPYDLSAGRIVDRIRD